MGIDDVLNRLKFYGVKRAVVTPEGEITEVEFFPDKPEVQPQITMPMNLKDHMPPDDVMLFAANEDPEEAMRARKE